MADARPDRSSGEGESTRDNVHHAADDAAHTREYESDYRDKQSLRPGILTRFEHLRSDEKRLASLVHFSSGGTRQVRH